MTRVILILAAMLLLACPAAYADGVARVGQVATIPAGMIPSQGVYVGGSGGPSYGSIIDYGMARSVQNEYPYGVAEKADSFYTNDAAAYSWVRVGHVRGPHLVEWRWHSPDGGLFFTESTQIGDYAAAPRVTYSRIPLRGSQASAMPGNWKVDVYQDGQMMFNQQFQVVVPQEQQPFYQSYQSSSYLPEPPAGYKAVASYGADCSVRPPGTYCLVFTDCYTYLAQDMVTDGVWGEAGTWAGRTIEVIHCIKADYYHIKGTPFLKIVPKPPYVEAYSPTKPCDCDTLSSAGKYDKAIECYDNAISDSPGDAWMWNNKGFVLNQMGRYQEAYECLDKAVQMMPDNLAAWNNKGLALMGMCRYEDAVGCFDQAASLSPYNAEAWYYKSLAMEKMDRHSEAGAAMDKAKSLGYSV